MTMRRSIGSPAGGFTLVELLTVVALISLLAGLLLPALSKAHRCAWRTDETSVARQVQMAAQGYSDDHGDRVFPGYVSDPEARDDRGGRLGFPLNARYPWRLAPHLGGSMDTLYTRRNRALLERLRRGRHADYVYQASVFPALGINSYFMGGNETEFPESQAGRLFPGTVTTRVSSVRRPADLFHFVSARSTLTGGEARGYHHVTPPYLGRRLWAAAWDPSSDPARFGFVAPRFSGRAVASHLDGHVEAVTFRDLEDMRRWTDAAERPDHTFSAKRH